MNKAALKFLPLMAMALAASGCATKTLKIDRFSTGKSGAPYSLRFTQFDVSVKWRVVSCNNVVDGVRKPLNVLAEVAAVPAYPDDPRARWILDLTSLDTAINTTDLKVTYKNGHFSSFNASVVDRTGQVATEVAGTIAKLATLPLPVAGVSEEKCADLVTEAASATTDVETATKNLAKAKREFLSAQAQGLPSSILERRAAEAQLAADSLKVEVEKLDAALKKVTYDQKLKWPKNGFDATSEQIKLPAEAITKWHISEYTSSPLLAVKLELQIYGESGELEGIPKANFEAVALEQIENETNLGKIPLRVPRRGALVATLEQPQSDQPNGPPPISKTIGNVEANIIQSGDLIYLPVAYKWPRSSTSSFGVDEAGNLASVAHKQTSAPAETIAGSLETVVEQADKVFMSDLEKLEAENKDLSARKANAELNAFLNPAEKSEYDLQLKALQEELALKKAQFELALINRWLPLLGE